MMQHPIRFKTSLLASICAAGFIALSAGANFNAYAQATPAESEEELLSLPPIDPSAEPTPTVITTPPAPAMTAPVPLPTPIESPAPAEEPEAPVDADEVSDETPSPATENPVEAPESVETPEAILPATGGIEPADEGDTSTEVDSDSMDSVVGEDAATPDEPARKASSALIASVDPDRPWGSSLMFPKQRMEDLVTIYDAYLANRAKLAPKNAQGATAGVNVQDIIRGTLAGGEKEVPEEMLVLTLSSIVYSNPNDWSVWLNGKRYFKQDALDGFVVDKSTLRVVSASKEQVRLVWTPVPESVTRIAGRWQARQAAADQPKPALMSDSGRVAYNDDASVTITLTPNQTFLSQEMAVFEGKVSPTYAAASVAKAAIPNPAAGTVTTPAVGSGYVPPAEGYRAVEPEPSPVPAQTVYEPADTSVFPGRPD